MFFPEVCVELVVAVKAFATKFAHWVAFYIFLSFSAFRVRVLAHTWKMDRELLLGIRRVFVGEDLFSTNAEVTDTQI